MNVRHIPYESLGKAEFGWLSARHHFSFGHYRNPERTGFGKLLVINDDIIQPKKGFDTHPHREMEIITFVRKGAISHKDSSGNAGRTEAGDVQVMSAGTGIFHSEYNNEDEITNIFQIWIEPDTPDVKPRWEHRTFPTKTETNTLIPLVSGRQEHLDQGAARIYQDATIFGGTLTEGTEVTQSLKHNAYVLVAEGEITVGGYKLKKGDGAEITDSNSVTIRADSESQILIIDTP